MPNSKFCSVVWWWILDDKKRREEWKKDGGRRQKATRLKNYPLWVISLNTISWEKTRLTKQQGPSYLFEAVLAFSLVPEPASNRGEDFLFPGLDEERVMILGGLVILVIIHVWLIILAGLLGLWVWAGGDEGLVARQTVVVQRRWCVVLWKQPHDKALYCGSSL